MGSPPVLNVANGLTLARILCTPPLVLLALATPDGHIAAALAFGALALTDALDGHIARSRQLITDLGKLLDPFADKLLVCGALLALVITDRLHVAVLVIIIVREVLVSALRQVGLRDGIVIPAGPLGKAKMAMQVTMVLVLLAFGPSDAVWLQVLIGATVVLTVTSGIAYFAALPRMRAVRAADATT